MGLIPSLVIPKTKIDTFCSALGRRARTGGTSRRQIFIVRVIFLVVYHFPLDCKTSSKQQFVLILTLLMPSSRLHLLFVFSSPVRSTRRAIVVTPVVHVCVPVPITLR